ncbi:YsnF/AvaK domain-containing protein [Streptomyces sp. NPDC012693]|uniref:YsnF/AvaK domain-containing protein n=1 Tax=Streptomyces sp. NPDC012693 TaxID=3364844 RepID=UPI0036D1EA51
MAGTVQEVCGAAFGGMVQLLPTRRAISGESDDGPGPAGGQAAQYVVTDDVQETVPVRRAEVRVEREPITDENHDAAMTPPDITEAEYEVILHEEGPVVQTQAIPVEGVRLATEEQTGGETATGEVREEKIKADTPDDGTRKR